MLMMGRFVNLLRWIGGQPLCYQRKGEWKWKWWQGVSVGLAHRNQLILVGRAGLEPATR